MANCHWQCLCNNSRRCLQAPTFNLLLIAWLKNSAWTIASIAYVTLASHCHLPTQLFTAQINTFLDAAQPEVCAAAVFMKCSWFSSDQQKRTQEQQQNLKELDCASGAHCNHSSCLSPDAAVETGFKGGEVVQSEDCKWVSATEHTEI
eukprot:512341-Pelagomonas_calceolata.AAC.6